MRVLRTIPSGSVQCVVTSPPYWGLRDYNIPDQIGLELTLPEFIASLRGVFGEVRRVLRDDGVFWLNIGDGYTSGNRGWRAPDKKNRARAMEVRPDTPLGLKPKDLIGIPWRLAFALQDDGWWLRSDIIWCLSGGTRVYARTQKGDMPTTIKDLVRLDPASVKPWNGEKWTQVLGFSETERPDKTYEIELRSGERVGCTSGHLWPTQRGNVRASNPVLAQAISCSTPFSARAQRAWLPQPLAADTSGLSCTPNTSCSRDSGLAWQLSP